MLDLSALLKPGLAGEVKKTVGLDDTAGASSPYLHQYLSTSACAALAVSASMAATEGRLPEGGRSVVLRPLLSKGLLLFGVSVQDRQIIRPDDLWVTIFHAAPSTEGRAPFLFPPCRDGLRRRVRSRP